MTKRILATMVLVIMLALSLTSCASLESYKRNLGDDYDTELLSTKEIEELADTFDIDADDYGIVDIMRAEEEDGGYYAYFVECGSASEAEELAEDLEYYIEILDGYYSFKIKAEVDGKFVLAGNASVVNKALDK